MSWTASKICLSRGSSSPSSRKAKERQARAASVNNVISQYADLVVGRMGVPYRERGLSIIALLVDGSTDALGAMTGKLGNIPGVKVRSVLLTAAGQELSPKEDS